MLTTVLSIAFLISIALLVLIAMCMIIWLLIAIIRERCVLGLLFSILIIALIVSTIGLYMLGVFK